MKKIASIIFLFITSSTFAQEFAPIGSVWHYTQHDPFNPDVITYETFESISDTSIEGVICKKLLNIQRFDSDTFNVINRYMYKNNDSVFLYENGAFHLLYDFGAVSGDTVVLDYFGTANGSPLQMIIDSTGLISINGVVKKLQHITCGDGIVVEFGNQVIEDIGCTYNMFPVYDGMFNGPLRCYEDSIAGLFLSPFHPNHGWNFIDCAEIITAIDEISALDGAVIYPNPAFGTISLKNVNLPADYFINDIYGHIVRKGKLLSSSKIDLKEISAGIYYISLFERDLMDDKQCLKGLPFIVTQKN